MSRRDRRDAPGDGPVPVERDALARPVDVFAPALLGSLLACRGVLGRVVEVEAYDESDPASHTHGGRTPSNATMFGPAGHLYVYVSHGIHLCANVVAGPAGAGEAVLLRAVEVVAGRGVALQRRSGRGADDARLLAGGPGRLGQAFGLRREDDGTDLLRPAVADVRPGAAPDDGPRLLSDYWSPPEVGTGPRVGVRLAADAHRRWWVAGSPAVSRYRRHPRA